MINLKSKLSMLVSVSLLGAMLVAPCAKAETDAEPAIQWATLYEQDFSESGLTLEKLTADGWSFDGGASMQSGYLRVGRVTGTDSLKGSAVFGKDLGACYRITATVLQSGNGFDLKYGGTATLQIQRTKVTFGGQTVERNCDNNKNTVTVTANNGTADMKISREGVEDQEIKGASVPTSGQFGLYSNPYFTFGDNLYNIKIEVPKMTATVPSAENLPAERPVEVAFSESVKGVDLTEYISVSPATDMSIALASDNKTAQVTLTNPDISKEYTLTVKPFGNGTAFLTSTVTKTFGLYKTVNGISENLKQIQIVKKNSPLTVWIDLSDKADVKSVAAVMANNRADAVKNSESGRYTAEITPTDGGDIWFEITFADDFVLKYKAEHPLYVSDFGAKPNNIAVDTAAGTAEASFDTDAEESLVIIALYDANGDMVDISVGTGSSAQLNGIASASGYTVKAMLIKNFGTPAMLCGGMEQSL